VPYSYEFSWNVCKMFLLAKARGWHVFQRLYGKRELYAVHLFMNDQKRWNRFKHLVSWMDYVVRLPGPRWIDDVWREQIALKFKYLTNV